MTELGKRVNLNWNCTSAPLARTLQCHSDEQGILNANKNSMPLSLIAHRVSPVYTRAHRRVSHLGHVSLVSLSW